jgi:hypothetical protein
MSERLRLDYNAPGKWPKVIRRMISAQSAYYRLIGICHQLDRISDSSQLRGDFLAVGVEHSIISYCSIFNSDDPSKHGIGRFSVGEVFLDNDTRSYHRGLVLIRDKLIAHLTDFDGEVEVSTYEDDRRLFISQSFQIGRVSNHIQPGNDQWLRFTNHITSTRDYFKRTSNDLQKSIEVFLANQHKSYFDGLSKMQQSSGWLREDTFDELRTSPELQDVENLDENGRAKIEEIMKRALLNAKSFNQS